MTVVRAGGVSQARQQTVERGGVAQGKKERDVELLLIRHGTHESRAMVEHFRTGGLMHQLQSLGAERRQKAAHNGEQDAPAAQQSTQGGETLRNRDR